MIPIISSITAAPRIVIPILVSNFFISTSALTVIPTLVAVSIAPIKILSVLGNPRK